jgi:hypothetical protein
MNVLEALNQLHARDVRAIIMSNPSLEAAMLALPPEALVPDLKKPHLTYTELDDALPRSAIRALQRLGRIKNACKGMPLRCWVKMEHSELLDVIADIRTRRHAQAMQAEREQAKRQRNKALQLARARLEPPMPILRPRSQPFAGAYA